MKHEWVLDGVKPFLRGFFVEHTFTCSRCKHSFGVRSPKDVVVDPDERLLANPNFQKTIPVDCDEALCKVVLRS